MKLHLKPVVTVVAAAALLFGGSATTANAQSEAGSLDVQGSLVIGSVAGAGLALAVGPTYFNHVVYGWPLPVGWPEVPQLAPAPAQYTPSNWVEEGTWCPAWNEWAHFQDGTTAYCSQVIQTDAMIWSRDRGTTGRPLPLDGNRKSTRVANSLAGRECAVVGERRANPSNGQGLICEMNMLLVHPAPLWRIE